MAYASCCYDPIPCCESPSPKITGVTLSTSQTHLSDIDAVDALRRAKSAYNDAEHILATKREALADAQEALEDAEADLLDAVDVLKAAWDGIGQRADADPGS